MRPWHLHPGVASIQVSPDPPADRQDQAVDRVARTTLALDPPCHAFGFVPVFRQHFPTVEEFEFRQEGDGQIQFVLVAGSAKKLQSDGGYDPVAPKLPQPLSRLFGGRFLGTDRVAASPLAVPDFDQNVRVEDPRLHRVALTPAA
jgi:hypothetical protein